MDTLLNFKNLEFVLKEYGKAVEDLYREKLINDDKKASGGLIDTLKYIYSHNGFKYEVSLYLKDYWYYVEHGRKPGKFPPVDKILEWIRIKPVLPYEDKNGRLPTENQLAFLIGRKIAEKGIKAGNQLKKTIEELNSEYMYNIEEALSQDLDESIGIIIKYSI